MKRFFALLLTLALALGTVVTPAWALEQPVQPDKLPLAAATPYNSSEYNNDSYLYRDDSEYDQGYNAGFDAGWQEGFDDSERDLANGADFSPKYHYDTFSPEDFGWETYEDGYEYGLKYGYWYSYYDNYYRDVYDAAYEEGCTLGKKDYLDGGNPTNEPPYPDSELYDDEGYIRAYGLYEGYWDAYEGTHWAEWEKQWQAELQAERNAHLTALGGTVGQINVRLNEKMIPFSDAFPEFQNGRTMLPVRALMEAIDATVTWDEDSQTITIAQEDGFALVITVGSDAATLTKGGETTTLTLDAPAYEKDGRVYVPLRLIGEALGYDVHWDENYQTVVLLDAEAVIAGIDEKFTAYNGFMQAHKFDLETHKQITDSLDIAVEMLDSIDGNRSFAFPARADTHLGDGGLTVEGYLDLGKLKELMQVYAQGSGGADFWPEELDFLSVKQEFALKLTPEGVLYLRCPLVDQLIAVGGGVAAGSFETWYQLDLNVIYPNWRALLELDTMGETAYWTTLLMSYGSPVAYYDEIMAASGTYESLLADDAFTRTGGEYRMKMDLEDLIAMNLKSLGEDYAEYGEMTAAALRETFSVFNFDLRFKPNGSYTLSAQVKMQMGYLGSVFNMVQNASGSTSGSEQSALFQVKNFLNVTMKESVTIRASDQAPNFELPAGVKVIDLLGSEAEPLEEVVARVLGQPVVEYAEGVFAKLQAARF